MRLHFVQKKLYSRIAEDRSHLIGAGDERSRHERQYEYQRRVLRREVRVLVLLLPPPLLGSEDGCKIFSSIAAACAARADRHA